jgi:hypothetical protein
MYTTCTQKLVGVQKHSLRSKTAYTPMQGDAIRTRANGSVGTNGRGVMHRTTAVASDNGASHAMKVSRDGQLFIGFVAAIALGYLVTRVALAAIRAAGRAWRGGR